MAKTTVEVEIVAVLGEANKQVKKFADDTQKSLDSLNFKTAVSAISDGFNIVKGFAGALNSVFGKAIEEALHAESSIRKLNNAMRLTGELSVTATQRANDYADELAKVTIYTDDQVLAALALAKNYGLVNSEAREVVKVAADLAEITGTDLNSAIQTLAGTFNGFRSKELLKIAPEIKNFTREQLAAGAAVEAVAKQVGGSARDAYRGLGGDLVRARKEVNDFYETIGGVALKTTAFLIRDTIALKNNILGLVNAIKEDSTLGPSIFDQVSKSIKQVRAANLEDQKEQEQEAKARGERIAQIAAEAAKAELEKIKSQLTDIRLASLAEASRISEQYFEKESAVRKAFTAGLIKSEKEKNDLINGLEEERLRKLTDLQNRQRQDSIAAEEAYERKRRDFIERASQQPIKELVNVVFGASVDTKGAIAIGAGIMNSIAKGAAGAADLVSSALGAIADMYLPGIGQAVKGIVDFLASGPDNVRNTVNAFVKEIPKVIRNIITSLPEIMIGFMEAIPDFISELIAAVPQIIEALIKALPRLFGAILQIWVKGIPIIIKEFVLQMPQIIKGFAEAIVGAAKDFVNAIFDAVKGLFGGGGKGAFGGIFGDGKEGGSGFLGGVGDFFGNIGSGIGDLFGFAEGGRVPDRPQFDNDGLVARLSSGEQVLNGDLTNKLEDFLNGGGGGGTHVVQLVLGDKVVAEQIYRISRKGLRTGFAPA